MARIFISYSRKDEKFARDLATDLDRLGADVWIDVDDIPVGMNWSKAIQQGLDSCEIMIIILSPDSMTSQNVEDEWQYFQDHPEGKPDKPLIPVLWRPARVHFQLHRLQYIDFHTQPYQTAFEQLYSDLGRKGVSLRPLAELDEDVPIPIQKPLLVRDEDVPIPIQKPLLVRDEDVPIPIQKPLLVRDKNVPIPVQKPLLVRDEGLSPARNYWIVGAAISLLVIAVIIVGMLMSGDGGSGDSDLKLDQSIESNGLSVKYPTGWASQADEESGQIVVANKQEIIDLVGDSATPPQAGEFGMAIMAQSMAEMGDMDARAAFEMLIGFMASEGGGEAPEIKSLKVGGHDGYRADVTPEDGTDGFIVGYEQDGMLVIIIAVSAKDEIKDFEGDALAIANTVSYTAPAG